MRSPNSEARLLTLFTERRAFYGLNEVRDLAGVSRTSLLRAIAEGVIELVSDGASALVAWEDVVALALTRWTPREVARAMLRAGHPEALPPLNRFYRITVELPAYQVRLLHYLAEHRRVLGAPPLTVSDVLEYELSALACGEDVAAIERMIPGFAAAANYPSADDQSQTMQDCCVFCGADVGPNCHVCAPCAARHEPGDL